MNGLLPPLRRIAVVCLTIASLPALAAPYRLPARRDSLSLSADRLIARALAHTQDQPGQSLDDLKQAARVAEAAGNKDLLLRAERAQRDLEYANGAFDASVSTGVHVLELSTSVGDRNAMADDLHALALGYQHTGALDEAVESAKRALFLWRTAGDSAVIARGGIGLADLLLAAHRTAEAKHVTEDALELFTALNDTAGMARCWARQGTVFIQEQHFSEALSVLFRAYRTFLGPDHAADRSAVLLNLVEANAGCGRWADARAELAETEAGLLESGRLNATPAFFALRARVEEGAGDLAAALTAQKRYAALRDSLFNDGFAERVAGLRTLYRMNDQEREVNSLREANKAKVGPWWSGPAAMRWGLLLVAVLLTGLVAVVIMYRRMHRAIVRTRLKNQVVNRQAEEIRAKNLELERQNMRLAETLMHEEEKDVILKEIHHRVKNNLQIAGTLLRMQATFAQDPRLEGFLHDCQSRILSMALVHEHIYKCGDLSRVNVKAHVMALGTNVLKNHGLEGRVVLDLNVTYDRATLDDLVPLSLLLNELLTNSAKHAFEGRDKGRVSIALRRLGEDRCELTFSDDGVGMGHDRFFSTESFGLELVRTLSAQLNGTIHLLKGEGTTFQLTFGVKADRVLRKAS